MKKVQNSPPLSLFKVSHYHICKRRLLKIDANYCYAVIMRQLKEIKGDDDTAIHHD